MSNKDNISRTTGIAAIFAGAMVALLAACSQTHVEPAAGAAALDVPSGVSEESAATGMAEIVIVASRETPVASR